MEFSDATFVAVANLYARVPPSLQDRKLLEHWNMHEGTPYLVLTLYMTHEAFIQDYNNGGRIQTKERFKEKMEKLLEGIDHVVKQPDPLRTLALAKIRAMMKICLCAYD